MHNPQIRIQHILPFHSGTILKKSDLIRFHNEYFDNEYQLAPDDPLFWTLIMPFITITQLDKVNQNHLFRVIPEKIEDVSLGSSIITYFPPNTHQFTSELDLQTDLYALRVILILLITS